MANGDIVNLILSMTGEFLTYMLPIVAIMSGIVFVVTWFTTLLLGIGRRTFRG